MHKDHIIEEVRRARRAYAQKFDFDLQAIYRDLKEKEAKNAQRVVRLSERRAEKKSRSAKGEYA